MKIFLLTTVVLGATLIGMAVGIILSNRRLQGSCGGLGKVMGEDCMFCDKKEQCKEESKQGLLSAETDLLKIADKISKEKSHLKLVE